jgi:mono/diheme cytochrome c family protein
VSTVLKTGAAARSPRCRLPLVNSRRSLRAFRAGASSRSRVLQLPVRAAFGALWLLVGCVDRDPMTVQERDQAFRLDPAFSDGQAMRPALGGTLSREEYEGELPANLEQPPPVTLPMLLTGRLRFEVWCAPCHGVLAGGDGPVAKKMMLRRPPSLLEPTAEVHPTLQEPGHPRREPAPATWEALPRPPKEYFSIITEGYGLMPAYGPQLPGSERWAIIAYLRALAFSQRAPLAAADEPAQARLLGQGRTP